VERYFDWSLQGVLSANVTKPFFSHETFLVPSVDHGFSCNWNWFFEKSHGPISGRAKSTQ
jgi:hypothetical protein